MDQQPTADVAEVARPWARPAVLVPVFVLVSLVAGVLPSFSLGANVLVLAVGGTLFWLGVTERVPPSRPAPRRLSGRAAWWLLPLLTFAAVELVNFAYGSGDAHPTLSKLADPLLDDHAVRAGAFFAWLTAFWGMVRR